MGPYVDRSSGRGVVLYGGRGPGGPFVGGTL